jgi:hypothetical protein
MDIKGNLAFDGNNGTIWVKGLPILTVSKAEAKKKISYEDVPATTGGGNVRIEVGHTIEVSFSMLKTGLENFEGTGLFSKPDMIFTEVNAQKTLIKTVKCSGITFDEITLASFEKNKVGMIEMTGQAETYEPII